MRRVALVGLIIVALLAAYAAWPIHTALKLREAMVAGDSAALAARIDWSAVRSPLKASISAEAMARLDGKFTSKAGKVRTRLGRPGALPDQIEAARGEQAKGQASVRPLG